MGVRLCVWSVSIVIQLECSPSLPVPLIVLICLTRLWSKENIWQVVIRDESARIISLLLNNSVPFSHLPSQIESLSPSPHSLSIKWQAKIKRKMTKPTSSNITTTIIMVLIVRKHDCRCLYIETRHESRSSALLVLSVLLPRLICTNVKQSMKRCNTRLWWWWWCSLTFIVTRARERERDNLVRSDGQTKHEQDTTHTHTAS